MSLWIKSYCVTIQMKATEQYFPVVLFIMLYKVLLTFESVDEFLWCYCSHETSSTELFNNSCLALYKQKIKFSFHCKLGLKRLMQRLPSKIITSKLKTWSLLVPKHAGSNGYPFLGPLDDQQCHAPSKGNLDSGNWEIVARGIRNRNPRLKNPENNSRNPKTMGIRNPSSTDKDWNPVRGIRNPRLGVHNPRLSWIPSHGARCRNSMKKLRNTPWYLRTFAEYLKVFLFCFYISCNKTKSREKSLINNWLKNILL